MRKKARFHSLKKLNIRQDWSRWSLYSLAQLENPKLGSRTLFQQKWTAKSRTRAYHGEQIAEKQWKRLFKSTLPAVVPMDHRYLAEYDGAEKAAGRGSGADEPDAEQARRSPLTPYMQMTYYPIERRLDTAIFRALFASSVRQAKQFCVHGLVKVNGKKMPHPSYMLNPGDMFQVEPSSVMYATGARKIRSSKARKVAQEKAIARAERRKNNPPSTPASTTSDLVSMTPIIQAESSPAELKKHMQALMEDVENVLNEDVGAKDKQKFRAFRQTIRRSVSLWKTASSETVSTLDAQFDFLKNALSEKRAVLEDSLTRRGGKEKESPSTSDEIASLLSTENGQKIKAAFDKLRFEAEQTSAWNNKNASAPYATPWRPRDYMSAFAFIPRYLEVNQNICAAVYLRHPVARPGLAEVPTPFHLETGQLAFNWYLRRR